MKVEDVKGIWEEDNIHPNLDFYIIMALAQPF